jgi:arylsulfatase
MWELYDLENDRSEMKNLANQHPQRVQDLSSKWQAWASRCKVTPWPWKYQP